MKSVTVGEMQDIQETVMVLAKREVGHGVNHTHKSTDGILRNMPCQERTEVMLHEVEEKMKQRRLVASGILGCDLHAKQL